MSDLQYFQGLSETAKDFTMKAFYAAAVRERNGGHLGACQHVMTHHHVDRSYGSTYYWTECLDCGTNFNHSNQQTW